MRNPFKRKALSASPDVLEAVRDGRTNFYPALGGTNQRVAAAITRAQSANLYHLYRNSPSARAVIDLIVRNIGQLDLRLYEEIDEAERQPRPDHAAALSLRQPNSNTPPDLFIREIATDYLIYGNCYVTKHRVGSRKPLLFQRLPPERVAITGQRILTPDAYVFYRDDGTEMAIAPEDMIHFRMPNSSDPRIGLSPLETLRHILVEEAAILTANTELAKSGLAEPSWVYRPLDAPPWSPEARQRFEEDTGNRLKRSNEVPPVMEEGMELKGFGTSPRDAQMLEIRRYILSQVANTYGVAVGMFGEEDLEKAQTSFYADTLPPYCEALTRTLNLSVLVAEYGEEEYCFEFLLEEKQMGQDWIKTLNSAAGVPILLRNEARAKINLSPVEGGDEPATPQNVTVGDKPSIDVMPIQDPSKPSQDGDYREQSMNGNGHVKAMDLLLPKWQAQQLRKQEYTEKGAEILRRHFSRQATSSKLDWERLDRELADDLNGWLLANAEAEGRVWSKHLMGTYDPAQRRNYFRATADDAAKEINKTTREELKGIKADTRADVFRRAKDQRADVAAGSLSGRTIVEVAEDVALASPFPRMKSWIPNTNRHAENAETVPVGQQFSSGSSPGAAPNCACVLDIS